MVEKFIVNPSEVRGLGDVVSPKSTHDFLDYNGIVTISTDSDYGTVFTESYRSGASLVLENSRSIGSGVGSFTVKATLKNSSNTAISGVTVHLVVNGNDVTGTTNNNGVVNFTVSRVSGVRKYSLTAYYIGDSNNGGCFATSSVFVNGDLEEFTLLSDKPIIQVGDDCNVFATLLDEDGEGLAMQEVMFYQEWTPGIKLGVEANPIQSGTGIDLSAQLVDTTDGSLIREAGHTVNFYIEAEPITTLTLTSNKSVLSYADSDTCTLTATYTENDTGVSGKTVEIYKGSTKLGNATDNGDGTYTYTLASSGAGDLSLTAKVGSLVSEIYSISDRIVYDDASSDKSSKYSYLNVSSLQFVSDHYEAVTTTTDSATNYYAPIYVTDMADLPSDYEISLDWKIPSMSTGYQGGFNISDAHITTYSGTNELLIGGSNARTGGYYRVNGNVTHYNSNTTLPTNTWLTLYLKVEGTSATFSVKNGSTTLYSNTQTLSAISNWKKFNIIFGGVAQTGHFKNLSIKPL